MNLTLNNAENYFSDKELEAIEEFVHYLQSELPLNKDTSVYVTDYVTDDDSNSR